MSGKRKTRVLVVDDDRLFREILAESLKREGFEVDAAPSGTAALELFRKRGFEVVVTDLEMPEMAGEDLAAAIKACSPSTVVIAMASQPVRANVRALVQVGCEGILSKMSLDVATVVEAIAAGQRRQRDLREAAAGRTPEAASREMTAGMIPAAEMLVDHLETLSGQTDRGAGKSDAHLMTRSLMAARQIRDALRSIQSRHMPD